MTAPAFQAAPPRSAAVLRALRAIESPNAATLAARECGCLWPLDPNPALGEGHTRLFCCNPVEAPGATYCRGHSDVAHGAVK